MKKYYFVAMVTLLVCSFVGVSTVTANDCSPVGTGTPGYWMNHPDAWPVDGLEIGGVYYPKVLAINLIKAPVKGDKSLTLFAAFVAAKLNVIVGNCPPDCYSFGEIDQWFVNFPVLSGVKANSEPWQYSHGEALYWCLDDYNNGWLDMPSRDDLD